MSSATFPAAPTPPGVRLAVRIGVGLGALAVAWGAVTIAGSGLGWLFLALAVICVVPALWQLGMAPHAYTVEGTSIAVHRRVLPDSTFTMRAGPERLAAATLRAASGDSGREGYGDGFARVSRRRTYHAVTDAKKGVRIVVNAGALVVSPDDVDGFMRATAGGSFP